MTALPVTVAGQPFDIAEFRVSEATFGLFFKSAFDAFFLSNNVLTKITDADYPGWSVITPTNITRAGSVATVTLPSVVNWQTGSTVTIAGCVQTEYNGDKVITVTDSTHFDYTVSGTPTTPATGTITATGGRVTVPSVVYLDGYFFVMDEHAVIYNCALNDPLTWGALDFLTAGVEPGAGVALAKSQIYIIALKEWSTEFFYNAGNAVGSPLSPVQSGFTLLGCAAAESVAALDDTVVWCSKARQKGPAVHRMAGLEQQKVSTPDIDRMLAADGLSDVYAYGIKIAGHSFYVLGLRTIGVTITYDSTSQTWAQWTSLTAQAPKTCTLTQAGGIATAACTAHGYADGAPVTIAGATETEYNGRKQVRVTGADAFEFDVDSGAAAPATGTIIATGYDEGYFAFTRYVNATGRDLVLHETTGQLCEITPSEYSDAGLPIALSARTGRFDGGTEQRKRISELRIVGTKQGGSAMVRHSDDDYQTNSACRSVDLLSSQARLLRCGQFRRRSFEVLHSADLPLQLEAIELSIT